MASKWGPLLSRRLVVLRIAVLGTLVLAAPGSAALACGPASAGWYSAAQAASGKTVFDTHCAACHLASLAGGAGPPLTGPQFVAWLQFTKITGADLFGFISSQMPYDAPGSLTKSDYEEAFAYILQVNHYPAGSASLDENSVTCVQMLPYPKQG